MENKSLASIILGLAAVAVIFFFVGKSWDTGCKGDKCGPVVQPGQQEQQPGGNTNGAEQTGTAKLYYYNPDLDKDASGNIKCSPQGLVSVEREIPVTQTPIQDAIKLLIKGELTATEKARGITTEYPLPGFSLKGADLKGGALTLEFSDPQNKTTGGSCRVSVLWEQIEATAKQFPEVREVKFIPGELFQP